MLFRSAHLKSEPADETGDNITRFPPPDPEPIPIVAIHGVASAAALQRAYEASIQRQRELYGPAKSTLDAADYLIDGKRPISELRAWLNGRSARDVAAIQEHIQKRRKGGTS